MARTTKIPTYDRQVGMSDQGIRGFSGGEIAQASDTGLESLGRGMVNLSGSLANIEKDRMRKEANLWASESYEKIHKKYTEWELQAESSDQTLDGKGHTTNALNQFQKFSDETLKEAPSRMAQDMWKQKMNQYKMSVFNSAIKYESSKRINYQKTSLENTSNGMALRFAEDPALWNDITSSFDQLLNGLSDSPETEAIEGYKNIWNKTTIEAMKKKGLAYIAETGIDAIAGSGDKGKLAAVKAQLDSGVFDKVLEADKLLALKNKVNGIVNQATRAAKAKFGIQQEDNIANIIENGKPVHDVTEEEFTYYYGSDNAEWVLYQEKVNAANKIYSGVTAMSGMSLTEQADYINKLPTKSAQDKDIKAKLIEQQTNMVKLMDDDPVSYAQRFRKDIFNKLSSDDKIVKQEGLFELEQLQKDFNKQQSDVVYLSDAQRNTLINTLTSPENADKETVQLLVTNLKEEYGDYFDNIMAELVIKGKMNNNLAAAMMYVDDIHIFGELFQAARMSIDVNAISASDKDTIKNDIQSQFISIRQALTRHNTAAIPMVDGWQNLMSKLISVRVAKGENVNDAISNVMERYITEKFLITENFIIPKSVNAGNYSEATIEAAGKSIIENLKESDIQVLMSGNPLNDTIGLDPKIGNYSSIQKDALETNVAWRNTADGSGLELVWSFDEKGTYPVYQMDGESGKSKVVVTWENLHTIISTQKLGEIVEREVEIPMTP